MATRQTRDKNKPPGSRDLEGWRAAAAAGQLSSFALEDLVAALQDLGPDLNPVIRNKIAGELNAAFYRILRPRVGFHHPNRGEDIIYRTIFKLFRAIAIPGSKDGKGMREACYARVLHRLKDAILEEGRERRIPDEFFFKNEPDPPAEKGSPVEGADAATDMTVAEAETAEGSEKTDAGWEAAPLQELPPGGEDDDAAPVKAFYDPSFMDGVQEMQESIDVKRLLEREVPDYRKRLAFYMHMEKVPKKTIGETTNSIAKALEVDEENGTRMDQGDPGNPEKESEKDMTNRNEILDRDDVLLAFQERCAAPTTEDIIEWVTKYPQFADDIRAHATIALDWEAQKDKASEPINERMVNLAFSHALNGLYAGDQTNKADLSLLEKSTFLEILKFRGKTVAAFASEIGGSVGLKRSIVAALFNGAMDPPIGAKFKEAVSIGLSINGFTFDRTLQNSISRPQLGLAKASVAPQLNRRSYEDIIKSSGMDPEQINFWLDKD